jgi:hypothetical protein
MEGQRVFLQNLGPTSTEQCGSIHSKETKSIPKYDIFCFELIPHSAWPNTSCFLFRRMKS